LTKQAACVERYRECTGECDRYHRFKWSADSKGSERLAFLVKQREEIQETRDEEKRDRREEGSVEETSGEASGHKVSHMIPATENLLMWSRTVRTY